MSPRKKLKNRSIVVDVISHDQRAPDMHFEDEESTQSDGVDEEFLVNKCKKALVVDLGGGSNKDVEMNVAVNIDKQVEYIKVYDGILIIIPQNLATTFHGLMSVKVLHGEVDILGYLLNSLSGTKEVFSPRGCSRLYIKNNGQQQSLKMENFGNDIFKNKGLKRYIIRKIKTTDSVLLCKDIYNFQVDFLVNHVSQKIYPTLYLSCDFNSNLEDPNNLKVSPQWNDIVNTMNENSRIFLIGGRNVGKSTMLRYMVNKLLMTYKEVLVLDLDPGQPEFTVSGCISASIVTEPLFGPNFTHLRKPVISVCLPDIDVSENTESYVNVVKFFMSQCKDLPRMPTIINYMGFTIGLALELLSVIICCVRPTDVVYIKSKKSTKNFKEGLNDILECNMAIVKQNLTDTCLPPIILTIDSMSDRVSDWNLEPRLVREMCVLNYFGTLITEMGMTFNQLRQCTYIVHASKVNIVNKDGPVSLRAINANIVTLCRSDTNKKYYHCIGWGIVRAVNFRTEDIYLITPIPCIDLKDVDTFMLGSVHLPPSLLMNVKRCTKVVPYVADNILDKFGKLNKRTHIPRNIRSILK